MSKPDFAARSEQSKNIPINLASLPREEAIERARAAGRAILADSEAISAVFMSLWTDWMNANVPQAFGQSEEEFGDLVNSMMDEFSKGLTAGVKRFAEDARTIDRLENYLCHHSRQAWKVYNVLAFMSEAISDDRAGELPVRCTVVDLRLDMEKLATSLMDLVRNARHG